LADVVGAAERMRRMVLDILDVSHRDEVALVPRRSLVGLAELVAAAVQVGSGYLRDGERRLSVAVAENATAELDPDLIERAIANLVDNAFKYSPIGSEISVVGAVNDGTVHI